MAYKTPPISTMSRPEWIADIPFAADTIANLPTQGGLIPNDRFLYALLLTFEGRFTQAASGNATGTQADGPFSILDSIQVSGYHRLRGAQEQFINVRACDMYEEVLEKTGRAPLSTGTLAIAANATSDIRFTIPVIFPPIGINPAAQIGYLLDAPNYDRLSLNVVMADAKSVFTGQTTQPTITAYGSTTGNARVRVHGIFAQAGASQFNGFVPARVWRYFHENLSTALTQTQTQVALENVSVGNFVRSLLLKFGVKSTATTAGYNAYNSLSNTIAQNIKLSRGLNKAIAFLADQYALAESNAEFYRISPSTGYGLLDWCPRGSLSTIFNTVPLVSGSSGDTSVQVIADIVGANNQGFVTQYEEVRGLPVTQ